MYAKGDIDGALAIWQEALVLAPGDTRALGYVDYVVSNYQVLRKPGIAEVYAGSEDGIDLAAEDQATSHPSSEPARDYPRTTVDDGWFLDDDTGGRFAAPVEAPSQAPQGEPAAEENEFTTPTPTVDAPSFAQQLAASAPDEAPEAGSGTKLGFATAPPPMGDASLAIDEDAALLEARLRGARHTLAPGSVPPVADIVRNLRPRLAADAAQVSPDRFSRPTAPPISDPSLEQLDVTAASIHIPREYQSDDLGDDPYSETSLLVGDTTAQVTISPQEVGDTPTGPMRLPPGLVRTAQMPIAEPTADQRTAQFDAVSPGDYDNEADFGDLERMDLDSGAADAAAAPSPMPEMYSDNVPRPGTYDGDVGDYELEMELAPEVPLQPQPTLANAAMAASKAPTAELFPEQTSQASQGFELQLTPAPTFAPQPAPEPEPDFSTMSPAAILLHELARATAHATSESERIRERITWLLTRALAARTNRDLPAAVLAAEYALRESPDSATAQKLIHGQATQLEGLFGEFLGPQERVPRVVLDMESVMAREIDPRGAFLLSRIDGMSTFEEIIDISGMPRLEALRHLAWFVADGVIAAQ